MASLSRSLDILANSIGGEARLAGTPDAAEVRDPATDEILGRVPLSGAAEVAAAGERIQPLFRLKGLLAQHLDELARSITRENGKTLGEARGEMQRAIENVEVACGIPSLLQGEFSEDIAPGIDEYLIRQPLGVAAIICPFNFPGMIPFWFLPYALACGNAVVVKPSERCPLTMTLVVELIRQAGFPPGTVNLVHGAAAAVDALLDHPGVATISFVGSTAVARH